MLTFRKFVEVVEELQNEKSEAGDSGFTSIEEVLSFIGRRKQSINMKRRSHKLKTARKIKMRRLADIKRLQSRARKSARDVFTKKYFGGKSKSQMTVAQKARVEKRLEKSQKGISRISKRLIPTKRALDIKRH